MHSTCAVLKNYPNIQTADPCAVPKVCRDNADASEIEIPDVFKEAFRYRSKVDSIMIEMTNL